MLPAIASMQRLIINWTESDMPRSKGLRRRLDELLPSCFTIMRSLSRRPHRSFPESR